VVGEKKLIKSTVIPKVSTTPAESQLPHRLRYAGGAAMAIKFAAFTSSFWASFRSAFSSA
jgi:hypothetical protein